MVFQSDASRARVSRNRRRSGLEPVAPDALACWFVQNAAQILKSPYRRRIAWRAYGSYLFQTEQVRFFEYSAYCPGRQTAPSC